MRKRTAFLFSGQGAQKVGMASECASDSRVAALFETAERIRPGIVSMMLEGSQDELNRTINTQPAMFLADMAYAYAAETKYGRPDAVCGFSVGEVPALGFADAVSVEDAFRIVCKRAELMDAAASKHPGAMVAVVGLDGEAVEAIADGIEDAWAVNYNAPDQTVVACAAEKADEVIAAARSAGGRGVRLKVSGAFHCPMMAEAAQGLKTFLQDIEFRLPRFPVLSNVTALPYPAVPDEMRAVLARQVVSPVQFVETVENMDDVYDIARFVECGPGKVLTGLIKKIMPEGAEVC